MLVTSEKDILSQLTLVTGGKNGGQTMTMTEDQLILDEKSAQFYGFLFFFSGHHIVVLRLPATTKVDCGVYVLLIWENVRVSESRILIRNDKLS